MLSVAINAGLVVAAVGVVTFMLFFGNFSVGSFL